jgi:tetrahydromethanopterin S-methyltransferase subunit H
MGALFMSEQPTLVEPKIVQIGDIVLGGRRGEYPTTLMLSIFHHGDRLVTNPKKGEFDKKRAKRYINRGMQLTETTGTPFILDVLAETPKAMTSYLDFLAENAASVPFLIDSSSRATRLAGIEKVVDTDRVHLAVFDAISHHTTTEELKALKTAKIEAAILLAHNPSDIRPQGRLETLRGTPEIDGLLAKAEAAKISKILIDTVALDLAGLSIAATAMQFVKKELGFPVGAGSANSIALWRQASKISPAAKRYLAPALCTYLQCHGANFILAGPLRRAPRFFSAVSVTDALIAYTSPDGSYPAPTPKTRDHPRYNVL